MINLTSDKYRKDNNIRETGTTVEIQFNNGYSIYLDKEPGTATYCIHILDIRDKPTMEFHEEVDLLTPLIRKCSVEKVDFYISKVGAHNAP